MRAFAEWLRILIRSSPFTGKWSLFGSQQSKASADLTTNINLRRRQMRRQPEPTLEDILSDSIIKSVMEADGVDPQQLAAMLKEVSLSRGKFLPSQQLVNALSRQCLSM
jgi:hypothetical protein